MNKNKKKIKIIIRMILLFLIVIIGIISQNYREILKEEVLKQMYGEPIDKETGMINNNYFSIYSDETHAKETTRGINKAILYAKEHNIQNIKLKKGTYLISSKIDKNSNYTYRETGIKMQSNISFDLNGSILKHEKTSNNSYAILNIVDVENIVIYNGILEGEALEHEQINSSTHTFGYGIDMAGGENIKIHNLEIKNMLGDGLHISVYKKEPKNIEIYNCNIHDCLRQGITVVAGKNVHIIQNEIYDIKGADPEAAIDLETGNDRFVIENIEIVGNKIYQLGRNYAILSSKMTKSLNIEDNDITGEIRIYNASEELKIQNNTIIRGGIFGTMSNSRLYDEKYKINKVMIEGNKFKDASISLTRLTDAIISDNELINGKIDVISMNALIYENRVINQTQEKKEYALFYGEDKEDKNSYFIISMNNKLEGNFVNKVKEEITDFVTITDEEEKKDNYIEFIKYKKFGDKWEGEW